LLPSLVSREHTLKHGMTQRWASGSSTARREVWHPRLWRWALPAVVALVCSCDESLHQSLDFTLYNRSFENAATTQSSLHPGDELTIASAWVAAAEIHLVDCGSDRRESWSGPFVVNMLSSAPAEGIDALEIPPQIYCKLQLQWGQIDSRAPEESRGAAIAITGLLPADGDLITILCKISPSEPQELVSVGDGFRVSAETRLHVGVDAEALFSGIHLREAAAAGGQIVIDSENNQELLGSLERNLKDAMRLFYDQDGDHQLGVEERSANDAIGR